MKLQISQTNKNYISTSVFFFQKRPKTTKNYKFTVFTNSNSSKNETEITKIRLFSTKYMAQKILAVT